MVMARKQVLVQLTSDLLAALDQEASRTNHSRSQLIREAVQRYLGDSVEADIDRRYVDAYTRIPQATDAWTTELARRSIAEEPW